MSILTKFHIFGRHLRKETDNKKSYPARKIETISEGQPNK